MLKLVAIVVLSFLPLIAAAQGIITRPVYHSRVISGGLDTPWEICWGPDNWIWYTERFGRISRINPETGERRIMLDGIGDLIETSESGLLGMAIDPRFPDSAYVYAAYSRKFSSWQDNLGIVRWLYRNDSLVERKLFPPY